MRRHLPLQPVEARQFDELDNLPERRPDLLPAGEPDPIGTLIDKPEIADRSATGSLPPAQR